MNGPRSAILRLLASAALGYGFGLIIGTAPAAREPEVVWAGQFAAPWLAMPWLVGWAIVGRRGGWVAGAAAGAIATLFAVHGYYVHWWRIDAATLELPAATPWVQAYLVSTLRNLYFASVWYVVGTIGGSVMGFLGWRYRRTAEALVGIALAAPFVLEPVGQRLLFGPLDRPEWVWAVEAGFGLALAAWFLFRARAASRSEAFA